MIYTKRANIRRYLGRGESLDTAIRHLLSADLTRLTPGRNEVDGDQVYINRFGYQTVEPGQAIWEGHERYGDMHVVLSGHERIGVTDASALTVIDRKPEEDFVGYRGDVEVWFPMTSEDVLIVYPQEAHMVKVIDTQSTRVEKACYKFRV